MVQFLDRVRRWFHSLGCMLELSMWEEGDIKVPMPQAQLSPVILCSWTEARALALVRTIGLGCQRVTELREPLYLELKGI